MLAVGLSIHIHFQSEGLWLYSAGMFCDEQALNILFTKYFLWAPSDGI